MTHYEELKSVVKELLDLNEKSTVFDIPGEYWNEGDGYISEDSHSQSMELTMIISRLRQLIKSTEK